MDDKGMCDALEEIQDKLKSPGTSTLDPSPHAQPSLPSVEEDFDFKSGFVQIVKQMNEFANDTKSTRKVMQQMSNTLGSLVEKMADMQRQMADARREKNEMLEQIKLLKKRLDDLETQPRTHPAPANATDYASVATNNLPAPVNSANKPAPGQPKVIKPLKAEYPRAAREILVSSQNAPLNDTSTNAADNALTAVNNAMKL
jgi:uncharacterized coiled-coil protein SlyX